MKRHLILFRGGTSDGHCYDTRSEIKEVRFVANLVLDRTKGGTLGKVFTMQGVPPVSEYVVTDRQEEDDVVMITLTHQETAPSSEVQ